MRKLLWLMCILSFPLLHLAAIGNEMTANAPAQVYQTNAISSPVIATLNKGDTVEAIESQFGWTMVRLSNNSVGYVDQSHLSPKQSLPTPTPPGQNPVASAIALGTEFTPRPSTSSYTPAIENMRDAHPKLANFLQNFMIAEDNQNPYVPFSGMEAVAKYRGEQAAAQQALPLAQLTTGLALQKDIAEAELMQAQIQAAQGRAAQAQSEAARNHNPTQAQVEEAQARVQEQTTTVVFKSTPEGADITVDGKFVGSTPSTIQLSPGDHQITIQKVGSTAGKIPGGEISLPTYRTWKRTLTLSPSGTITVDATLEPMR